MAVGAGSECVTNHWYLLDPPFLPLAVPILLALVFRLLGMEETGKLQSDAALPLSLPINHESERKADG
ncbi:hypothetical protein EJ06DRAFT_527776 [Trichodelitschia bisporula]|uniref:Uncharacterized protein n=1 Tax=Trichodelitschia bisporula TaxID=703511 RepID=A0A6G1I3D5_9PEZI|nr:hypothetical protein EJ06DRAFT_527776 [Trichodelitschia bisporula]